MFAINNDNSRFIDNLTTAVLMFGQSGLLCDLNSAAEDLLSCSARKVVGLAVENILPIAPFFSTAVRNALLSGESLTERDMELVLSSDKSVAVDCVITPLIDNSPECYLLVELVKVDWHQRIAKEEHILTQQQMTSELLQGMAHEVKNPLGGIRGAAQLLEGELTDKGLHEYTRIIISEVDRLGKLLDRMVGPKVLPHVCEQNIHEILEHVRSLVEAEVSDTIVLLPNYDPSLPAIYADRDQLVQVFLNIVQNAVQSIDKQPGRIELRTRVQRQVTIGNHQHRLMVRVDVIDDGPGILEDIREKLFYPLVTGRADGTGLGLSIAQSLVQSQGGLIECETDAGLTCFTIFLPLEAVV